MLYITKELKYLLKIILCEDNEIQRSKFEKIIENISFKNKYDFSLGLSTESPKAVLRYVKNQKLIEGIYFLDIELAQDINGIELAKAIRKYDPRGYIIFITSHYELSLLTFEYKVQALDYIIKCDDAKIAEKIHASIDAAHKNSINNLLIDTKITINSGNRLINLKLDEIMFFETSSIHGKVRVHCISEQIEFYYTIKELLKILNDDFMKIHRSIIVNIKNIKELDKKSLMVRMVNDEICYISNTMINELIEKWNH